MTTSRDKIELLTEENFSSWFVNIRASAHDVASVFSQPVPKKWPEHHSNTESEPAIMAKVIKSRSLYWASRYLRIGLVSRKGTGLCSCHRGLSRKGHAAAGGVATVLHHGGVLEMTHHLSTPSKWPRDLASWHGYIFGRHTILDSQSINPPYFPTGYGPSRTTLLLIPSPAQLYQLRDLFYSFQRDHTVTRCYSFITRPHSHSFQHISNETIQSLVLFIPARPYSHSLSFILTRPHYHSYLFLTRPHCSLVIQLFLFQVKMTISRDKIELLTEENFSLWFVNIRASAHDVASAFSQPVPKKWPEHHSNTESEPATMAKAIKSRSLYWASRYSRVVLVSRKGIRLCSCYKDQ